MDFATARRDSLVRYLRQHVSGEVRFDDTSRRLYATDASHYQIRPLGVVIPKTADDLTVTVQIAADLDVPITARGGGTSLSGQSHRPRNRHRLLEVPQRRRRSGCDRPPRPRSAGRRARSAEPRLWPRTV